MFDRISYTVQAGTVELTGNSHPHPHPHPHTHTPYHRVGRLYK